MTEEEAKTKWCHRAVSEARTENCFGSRCMAWRWNTVTCPMSGTIPDEPVGYSATNGYCGLAGPP